MEVKNLNNLLSEPTQAIPLWKSPLICLPLDCLSSKYMFALQKPVVRHRYSESLPIALPTLCIVVFILNTSNHPMAFAPKKFSHVYVHIVGIVSSTKIHNQSHLSRGYPYKLISEEIIRASQITIKICLICNSSEKPNEKRIAFLTQVDPSISTFMKKVNEDWLIIRRDNRFYNKLSNPIILAKNSQLIYNSDLPTSNTPFCNVFNHATNHDE